MYYLGKLSRCSHGPKSSHLNNAHEICGRSRGGACGTATHWKRVQTQAYITAEQTATVTFAHWPLTKISGDRAPR